MRKLPSEIAAPYLQLATNIKRSTQSRIIRIFVFQFTNIHALIKCSHAFMFRMKTTLSRRIIFSSEKKPILVADEGRDDPRSENDGMRMFFLNSSSHSSST